MSDNDNGNSNKRANGTKRTALHKFFFINPKVNADAEELAENIAKLPSVQEVYLTDGDCGYIVKARFFGDKEPRDVMEYISNNIDKRFGKATSYVKYAK